MSRAYTADGKRKSSMTHANRSWTCPCGRKVWGNGGKSGHRRACRVWKQERLTSIEETLARHEGKHGTAALPASIRYEYEVERVRLRAELGVS